MADVKELLKIIDEEKLKVDRDLLRLAFEFAQEAHQGRARKNGEPYINHPFETAKTLARYHLDQDTIIAGLLHDVPEDTDKTLAEVRKEFGKDVAGLVEGITKLGKLKYRGIERYIENLRKMFVAMASDIRVIFIKFADRLHNLKTLDALEPEKRERIARETLEIYAPIANRLGIWQLKGKLEDLSFKHLYPAEYESLKQALDKNFKERDEVLNAMCARIGAELKKERMKVVEISGRTKDMWSLYNKLQTHNNEMHRVHDIIALRVVVPTIADCYRTLGIIHNQWKPLPNRFKDFIAQPKPNGYQSVHTTIFCDRGKTIEVQIKTPAMHHAAEYGIAAHWHYDERGSIKLDKTLDWVQELSKWQQEIKDSGEYLDSLKLDVFGDRIFVFTPKGDVIDLPENSTPVDFAYHIHTQIGDKAGAARVNNQMASLDTPLKSGDMVEIIVERSRKGPNRDWLKFVKTRAARDKIKAKAPRGLWGTIASLREKR
ncbi:MAG: bifunctional (p)ppGpp synthetase/guanosine-3',5'-bis(diphosphate) 3'-pyrophosphohydrolase [Parcubacteria group bacterium]|nr:bifunctional (p)ppGpp synthetase/guanosine-3',5'-bis(diphosphate) 3'-pyrophosphohydrolase [Parcubacteria group bacterium]